MQVVKKDDEEKEAAPEPENLPEDAVSAKETELGAKTEDGKTETGNDHVETDKDNGSEKKPEAANKQDDGEDVVTAQKIPEKPEAELPEKPEAKLPEKTEAELPEKPKPEKLGNEETKQDTEMVNGAAPKAHNGIEDNRSSKASPKVEDQEKNL